MFDLVPPHQHINHHHAIHDPKLHDGALYMRQSNAAPTHAVIQLIEVSPPPPRRIASVIHAASVASSSYESGSSYYSSSYDSEGIDIDEDAADEEAGSSYCSSDEDDSRMQSAEEPAYARAPAQEMTSEDQEAFTRRMKRILVWRELTESASDASASAAALITVVPAPISLKRTASSREDDCDAPSSKRSRCTPPPQSLPSASASVASDAVPSLVSSYSYSSNSAAFSREPTKSVASALRRSLSPAELCLPSCAACDAVLPSLDAFRAHAAHNEACGVAVEYAFEK